MIYLELFWSFFQIGLMSIGGGYAALPLIQQQIVEINGWLTLEEFVNLITIAEMTPGPIGINAATFVGTQILGLPGAIIATIGFVLPSCFILLTLAYLFSKYKNLNAVQGVLSGLRPAVVALIASAGLSIFLLALFGKELIIENINYFSGGIFLLCLLVLRKFKPNPIVVMVGAGVAGVALHFLNLF